MLNRLRQDVRLQYLLVVCGVILFRALTTPSSAFFLHEDTANQHVTAIELIRGCFMWTTEKWFPAFVLSGAYSIFGIQNWLEPLILMAFAAATALCVFSVTKTTTKSLLWALVAVVLLEALPAYQYFSRTYWGYTPLLLLAGWMLLMRDRWFWGAFLLGAAVISHFNAMVFVFFSTLILAAFFLRPSKLKQWGKYVVAGILPLFLLEIMLLAYMGPNPFPIWTSGVYSVLTRLGGGAKLTTWKWLFEAIVGTNGIWLTLLLLPALVAPYVLRRDKYLLAFSLSGLFIAAFYTFQAGVLGGTLLTKVLVLQYPFWAALAAISLAWGMQKIPQVSTWAGIGVLSITLVLMVDTGVFMRTFTQTAYPIVDGWFDEASEQSLVVKQVGGNIMPPQYFAQKYGVATLVHQADWVANEAAENAVLVFLSQASPNGFAPDGYSQDVLELPALSQRYPLLTAEASVMRYAEVWWPSSPTAAPITVREPLSIMDVYFDGQSCIIAPQYGDGTLHYIQVVLGKLF